MHFDSEKRMYGAVEHREGPKPKHVEDLVTWPPVGKEGQNIPRVSPYKLSAGKETHLKLSSAEVIRRDGWNVQEVMGAQVGHIISNASGEQFTVTHVSKGEIKLRNVETDELGIIQASPRSVKSHEYRYQAKSGGGSLKTIIVHDLAYKDRSLETMEFIDNLVGALPTQFVDCVDEIRIDRTAHDAAGVFRSESTVMGKSNIITIHVEPSEYSLNVALENLYHELGHAVATSVTGNSNPGPKWKQAMAADGNNVSEYASTTTYAERKDEGEIEDFAEAVRLYLAADGAIDPKYQALRKACENRFWVLDAFSTYQHVTGFRRLIQSAMSQGSKPL